MKKKTSFNKQTAAFFSEGNVLGLMGTESEKLFLFKETAKQTAKIHK